MTVLMETKFKTAWKLFCRSERLQCQSVTLKWNICERLVGRIDVTANNGGTDRQPLETCVKGGIDLVVKMGI
jgi:hypothetical protein